MTTYSDKQLTVSSSHLIYHIRMYVETFLWLQDHPRSIGWDTVRNSVLEDHLVHARVLIHFMQHDSSKKEETDVFAAHYFYDCPSDFSPLKNEFLKNQAKKIGGQLVHLTTKSSLLKSEQEWQIGKVAISLMPAMQEFLSVVPNHRLPIKINEECRELIKMISSKFSASTISLSTSSAT